MLFGLGKIRESRGSPLKGQARDTWASKEPPIRHPQLTEQGMPDLFDSVLICGHPHIGNGRTTPDDNGAAVNRFAFDIVFEPLAKALQFTSEGDYCLTSATNFLGLVLAIH